MVIRFDPGTYRYKSAQRGQAVLEQQIRKICHAHVCFGCRRVHVLLRREGCLAKNTEALTGFYDFRPSTGITREPRTRSSVSSPLCITATVRTKGALSQKSAKLMVFTIVRAALETWRKHNGTKQFCASSKALHLATASPNPTPTSTALPSKERVAQVQP